MNHNREKGTSSGIFGASRRGCHSKISISDKLSPRNLTSNESYTASARWPIEMQVINERIRHIDYVPIVPESLSTSVVKQESLTYMPSKKGNIVFSYPVICGMKFSRSYIGSQISLESDFKRKYSTPSLVFESRFESGNLARAIQIDETTYELYLRPDLYSRGHCQWFYFRVQNMKTGIKYKFSIVNLHKISGLFNCGVKLLMYSDRLASLQNIGWHRVGENIFCCKNEKKSSKEFPKKTQFHTLTWTVEFPYENDIVYFARSYPYTYSDLQEYLDEFVRDPIRSQRSNVEVLCKTLAGNNIYLVTITNFSVSEVNKKIVILTARIHPGETPSSWVMKGFLDYLTSEAPVASKLRDNFIFKLIPMLNPDGVIVGNNRFSLSGYDLNRTYRTLLKNVYPPTWHVRIMVRKLMEEYEIALYCDLHAHSSKTNMFLYGCESSPALQKYSWEQLFPLLLSRHAPELFSFEQCRYRINKKREGTGRVVMWMLGINNSFTLEVSTAGSTLGFRRGTHFAACDYIRIAYHFCNTMEEYFDESKTKFFENQLEWNNEISQQVVDIVSSKSEPVAVSQISISQDSDSSDESVIELQSDESLHSVRQHNSFPETIDEKKVEFVEIAESSTRSRIKPKLNKTFRVSKTVPFRIKEKPKKKAVWQPFSHSQQPKKKESRSNKEWREYEQKYEERNRDKYMSSFTAMRPRSPRRTRLRSLLNLQRNIVAQAIILRETSPAHRTLAKDILKETETITEVLAKELKLMTDEDKLKKDKLKANRYSHKKVTKCKSEPSAKLIPKKKLTSVSERTRQKSATTQFNISKLNAAAIYKMW